MVFGNKRHHFIEPVIKFKWPKEHFLGFISTSATATTTHFIIRWWRSRSQIKSNDCIKMFLINRVLRFISLFSFYNRWNVIFEKFPLISLILFLFSLIIRWLNEMKETSTQFLHILRNSKCWSKKCIPIPTLQRIKHQLEMNLFHVKYANWMINY